MFDDELRTLLREKAEEAELPARVPPQVLERARRGRRAVATAGAVLAAVLVAGSFTGIRLLLAPSPGTPAEQVVAPSPPATPTFPSARWRGIWPEATREEAEIAQLEADRGHHPWRLDPEAVLEAFARQELGWDRVYFDDSFDVAEPDETGLGARIYTCDPLRAGACQAHSKPLTARVSIERLLRHDRTGVWFVTRVKGPIRYEPRSVPEEFPPTFVGVTAISPGDPVGQIVLVDTRTGQRVRTIIERVELSEGVDDLALSADGSVLYYEQGTSACESRIMSVPVQGGEPQAVVQMAGQPAPSPDGRLLAYVSGSARSCPGEQDLVVRDLTTGTERRWDWGYEMGAGVYGACQLAWLPDSRRLAFTDCAEEGQFLRLLDVEADTGVPLQDARSLGPSDRSFSLVGYHAGSSGIAAVMGCWFHDSESGACTDDPRLVSVDPDTGEVVATLLEDLPPRAGSMVLDASGRHFLWVIEGDPTRVFGWRGEGDPVEIAQGYGAAVW